MRYDGYEIEALGDYYLLLCVKLKLRNGSIQFDRKGRLTDPTIKEIFEIVSGEITKTNSEFSLELGEITTNSVHVDEGVSGRRETAHRVNILATYPQRPLATLPSSILGPGQLEKAQEQLNEAENKISEMRENLASALDRVNDQIKGVLKTKPPSPN